MTNQIKQIVFPLAMCFVLATANLSFTQETEELATPKCEMAIARILVLDPDGHPLDGATVTQEGLLSKAAPNSLFSWRVADFGPEPKTVTNADGNAEFPFPKQLTEKEETDGLRLVVEHPEFVRFFSWYSDIHIDPVEIKLERGFRIAASAVHGETGQAIKTDLFALANTNRFETWKLHDNGMLVSPVFKEKETLLRVMQIVKGKPTLFSKRFQIKPDGSSRVRLKDVKLFPGTRVEGRLADSVTRPVRNGYVCGKVIHLPDSGGPLDDWFWQETAPIAADGTFVFESLPSDEVLQLVPICDDWVPAEPNLESVLKFFPQDFKRLQTGDRLPQLLALTGGTTDAVLQMVPATSARVTVLDPEGNPLANADVWMQPSQHWFGSMGSSNFGHSIDVREILLAPDPPKHDAVTRGSRFHAKSNNEGVAVISNLPVNGRQRVDVYHNEYELPETDSFLTYTVRLKPDEVAEIAIQMQDRGTEVLGATDEDASDVDGKPDEGGGVK